MHLPSIGAVALCAVAVLAQNQPNPQPAPPRHLVAVRTTGPAQMQQLLALDLDFASCTSPLPAQRRLEAIVTDQELAQLRQQGFAVQVLQRDLAAWYAAQAAQYPTSDDPQPPLGQGAMGGHWTLAQMETILDAMHAANPAICSAKTSIGSTIENRSIWMVKISDNVGVDENEPEVLYDALHHAREPLSMEATIVFMDWLVTNYGTDPEATFLVDERELYFVPCLNPDGYEYNYLTNPGGGGLWRKNRRDNGGGIYGVDLNRNYATGWSAPNGGSSTSPSSETYRGTAAFSEPETQAIEAFAQSRQFVTVFTTHTYQDVLLRPWGYQLGDPANVADYDTLGAYYTQENGLQHGSIGALLYIASGNSVDHHHAVRAANAWTAELGRSNEGGFWPSGPAITSIATRHQPMFHKIAETAGAALRLAGVAVVEASGSGNGNGQVEAGETGNVFVNVENIGLAGATATAALQSLTPGVTVGTGSVAVGAIARLSMVASTVPLTFAVAANVTAPTAQVRVQLTGDGRTSEQTVTIDLIARRLVLRDDAERDRGFTRAPGGTATTGLWERAAPNATTSGTTTIQPGTQATPGGALCFVTDGRGGAAGTYDVDGGYTDLLSPVIDLSHLQSAKLGLSYWYAESLGDDPMAIAVSRDGGANWSPLFTRSTATGAWQFLELDLGAPLTAQMRIRVRAQDLNPSLVECLIDDVEIWAPVPDGAITMLGSGGPGTTVQLAMNAGAADLCFALASFATHAGQSYAGVGGQLLLDPATAFVRPLAIADAAGRAVSEFPLPATTAYAGLVFHWQAAVFGAGGAYFGGNTTSLVLQ